MKKFNRFIEDAAPFIGIAILITIFIAVFIFKWSAYFDRFPNAHWWSFFIK